MTTSEAAALLDLIGERAELLAKRGVRRVELGAGVAFTLADPEPEVTQGGGQAFAGDELPTGALDDPMSFGLAGDGRRIQRRTRRPLVESE